MSKEKITIPEDTIWHLMRLNVPGSCRRVLDAIIAAGRSAHEPVLLTTKNISQATGLRSPNVCRAVARLQDISVLEKRYINESTLGSHLIDTTQNPYYSRIYKILPPGEWDVEIASPKVKNMISDNISIPLDKLKHKNKKVKSKKKKKKKRKKNKFIPPTLTEVKKYTRSRQSSVVPEDFYDFFKASEKNGKWYDSRGNEVKNWKQKLITWEQFNKDNNEGGISKF